MTEFTEVYDLFLMLVQDYKFNELLDSSEADLSLYLKPFLLFSIQRFSPYCVNDLSNKIDNSGDKFTIDLTLDEKVILARLMVQFWLERMVQDITQINGKLNDTDFKHFSEAQNLKSKQDYLNTVREDVAQIITNYQLNRKVVWGDWANGEFYKF